MVGTCCAPNGDAPFSRQCPTCPQRPMQLASALAPRTVGRASAASTQSVTEYLDDGSVTCPWRSARWRAVDMAATLTSGLEDLARPLRPVGERQGDNLIVPREFNLRVAASATAHANPTGQKPRCPGGTRTFSRMTRGPLTPPTVLYRILGTIEYDDESRGSPMAAMRRAHKGAFGRLAGRRRRQQRAAAAAARAAASCGRGKPVREAERRARRRDEAERPLSWRGAGGGGQQGGGQGTARDDDDAGLLMLAARWWKAAGDVERACLAGWPHARVESAALLRRRPRTEYEIGYFFCWYSVGPFFQRESLPAPGPPSWAGPRR